MNLSGARVIPLRRISNPKGNLTPIEEDADIPFAIKRVYYLYDVPSGEARGGHAHRALQQLIIAVSGSFDVILDDSRDRLSFFLNRPDRGLYVPPGLWRELENFSSGAVSLVLASQEYDENDYIREYNAFVASVRT
jgi:oxalate decarboxylase/phosphoglucose isomerase-like protein (cupin superfamily)